MIQNTQGREFFKLSQRLPQASTFKVTLLFSQSDVREFTQELIHGMRAYKNKMNWLARSLKVIFIIFKQVQK
jgi:hypothetical protein